MPTTLGCWRPAADWASRWNRWTNSLSWAKRSWRILIATFRSSSVSSASQTSAIPPEPIFRSRRYRSSTVVPWRGLATRPPVQDGLGDRLQDRATGGTAEAAGVLDDARDRDLGVTRRREADEPGVVDAVRDLRGAGLAGHVDA